MPTTGHVPAIVNSFMADHNWVRRVGRVKRVNRWKMEELIVETGDWNEKDLKMKTIGSRMRWTGHVQETLTNRAWHQMRWETKGKTA